MTSVPRFLFSSSSSSQYSRSPSPLRAISLDARCTSPAAGAGIDPGDMRTPSPSCSLASVSSSALAATSGGLCSSPKFGRCLSPLLIPPRSPLVGGADNCGPTSPLGALQLDLYTRQEGPIYLTTPDNGASLGRIHLRIKYDSKLSDLTVHLIEAHNLSSGEEGGFRDPYVRLMLNPEVDQRKRETSIHRRETNPYFDQHFKFPVSRDQLQGKELTLQVLDYDRYSHNDIVGEVKIQMDELDLSKSVEIWGDLLKTKRSLDRPELLLSLNYLPQAERLTVVLMKGKNLEVTQDAPYVKLYLIVNGKRVKKKKTSLGKSNDPQNPIWNEAFTFNVPQAQISVAALEVGEVSDCNVCSEAVELNFVC